MLLSIFMVIYLTMKKLLSYLRIPFALAVILLVVSGIIYSRISSSSAPYLTSDLDKVSPQKAGLLLGTNKYFKGKRLNLFFLLRIDAAVGLYRAKKIKYIIVSGNSRPPNREAQDMREELISRGIPSEVIFIDYAGYRTLDSVLRARDVFGQDTFLVISQPFHNERAVFIARQNGIRAYGYNAGDVKALAIEIREFFARDKVFLDMLFGVKARVSGKKVEMK
ncbi:vancomycin high temperature exclusion protein [Emticicia sp. CRIBPO]|uniref:SanA/YdcF family protein n=1 Tax=Emticicia sp. CRIBPO TaxID=2683258 RepID=UPI00197A9B44|nr:ElyC/SanA/YdcF family protein [Emticicia sp. CRIBPO]